MEERRVSILKELIERSDLKGVNKVIISLEGNEILLRPYEDDLEDIDIIAIRSLDDKGLFALPKIIHMDPKEIIIILREGRIWMKRCVL